MRGRSSSDALQDRSARDRRRSLGERRGLEEPSKRDELPDEGESMGLASRAKAGDRAALELLLARHEPWLRRVARIELGARLRRHLDSMDLVQEVGLIAFEKIAELRSTSASGVRGWMRSVLTNHLRGLLEHMTAQKRDIHREVPLQQPRPWETTRDDALDPAASQTGPDEAAERLEMRELLDELVSELPDAQRAVVLLRDFDHATWEEIGERLDKPTVGAAQQLHQRAWVAILDKASRRLK